MDWWQTKLPYVVYTHKWLTKKQYLHPSFLINLEEAEWPPRPYPAAAVPWVTVFGLSFRFKFGAPREYSHTPNTLCFFSCHELQQTTNFSSILRVRCMMSWSMFSFCTKRKLILNRDFSFFHSNTISKFFFELLYKKQILIDIFGHKKRINNEASSCQNEKKEVRMTFKKKTSFFFKNKTKEQSILILIILTVVYVSSFFFEENVRVFI